MKLKLKLRLEVRVHAHPLRESSNSITKAVFNLGRVTNDDLKLFCVPFSFLSRYKTIVLRVLVYRCGSQRRGGG